MLVKSALSFFKIIILLVYKFYPKQTEQNHNVKNRAYFLIIIATVFWTITYVPDVVEQLYIHYVFLPS